VPRGDGFPTADHWIAMGDSYSAGVGAGSLIYNPRDLLFKCLTTANSYALYLERGYDALRRGLEFLSCTGDKIENVNDAAVGSKGRGSQLQLLQSVPQGSYKFATLSIGGNDLGFAGIVKSCILIGSAVGNCEDALKRAESIAGVNPRDSALNAEVFAKLKKVYRDILDTAGDEFTLVVTGYAKFFAEPSGNPDCNNGNLQLPAVSAVYSLPLTEDLRRRINSGIVSFNSVLRGAIYEVQQDLEREGFTNKRIRFFDTDPIYEGHRFCEPHGSSVPGWPEFGDQAWFFPAIGADDISPDGSRLTPRADENDPGLELDRRGGDSCSDPYWEWDCALGELLARDPDLPLNEKQYPQRRTILDLLTLGPLGKAVAMKLFHPKSIAYDAIAKQIAESFGE
jgi:hypothetical protein